MMSNSERRINPRSPSSSGTITDQNSPINNKPIKYTIDNSEYTYNSPSKDEELKSIHVSSTCTTPKRFRMRMKYNDDYSSPTCLIDFEGRKKQKGSSFVSQQDLHEDYYAADKEDNLILRKRLSFEQETIQHFEDKWRTKNEDVDEETENGHSLFSLKKNTSLLDGTDAPNSPPQIKRKSRHEMNSPMNMVKNTIESLDESINSSNSKGDPVPTESNPLLHISEFDLEQHDGGNESVFPRQPFNAAPSLYPSSYDTSTSGYGSLDYSSEDQSYDTPKTSNVKLAISTLHGKSRSKSSTVSRMLPEHLPLVPEIPASTSSSLEDSNNDIKDSHSIMSLLKPAPQSNVQTNTGMERRKFSHLTMIRRQLEEVRGIKQEQRSCRDFFFALLFFSHLLSLLYIGFQFGPQAFGYHGKFEGLSVETGNIVFTHRNIVILTFGVGIITLAASIIFLMFMKMCRNSVVPITLFAMMSSALLGSIIGLIISPQSLIPVIGLVVFGTSVGYTFTVWDNVPFVTAQLNIALYAINDNFAMITLACLMQMAVLTGIMFYFFTCIGVYHYFDNEVLEIADNWKLFIWAGIGISFIWTFQVLMNILKATTSGIVEHWWSDGPDPTYNKETTVNTFFRVVRYSFGSICLGSLFIGPAQFLRQVAIYIRPNKEEAAVQVFVIFQEVIVSFIDLVCVKFNKWAFSYIGIYGYDYIQAGIMAQKLFDKRGWSEIVSYGLLENVLFAVSLVIGGLVGLLALMIENITNAELSSSYSPSLNAFMIGFLVGVVQSNVLFCIITSTVDTIMICFAGSPDIFERRYPCECMKFRFAWKVAWPGTIDNVNGKIQTRRRRSLVSVGSLPNNRNGPAHLLGSSRSNLDQLFV